MDINLETATPIQLVAAGTVAVYYGSCTWEMEDLKFVAELAGRDMSDELKEQIFDLVATGKVDVYDTVRENSWIMLYTTS